MKNPNFDLVICLKALDSVLLPKLIKRIKEHIKAQKILIITNKNTAKEIKGVEVLDENKILKGLNLDVIKEILLSRGANPARAGWYFQQFLKMGYARFIKDNLAKNGGGGGEPAKLLTISSGMLTAYRLEI